MMLQLSLPDKQSNKQLHTHIHYNQRRLSDPTVSSSHVCQNALLHKVDLCGVDGHSGSLQNRLHISDISTPTDNMQFFQESVDPTQQNWCVSLFAKL